MKGKRGFTLVEMLIVVIIIGILSVALLPRLTGYMAKTRDTKRQADLRNIAAAIKMYKNEHGQMPVLGDQNGPYTNLDNRYAGSASELIWALSDYIKEIPTDPKRNNSVHQMITTAGMHRQKFADLYLKKGEYLYYTVNKTSVRTPPPKTIPPIGGLLIAKVETPDAANYVLHWNGVTGGTGRTGGGFWWQHRPGENWIACPAIMDIRSKLCTSSPQKGQTAKMEEKSDGSIECDYVKEDQLYYIVYIE